MELKNLIPQNEIAVDNWDDAVTIARILIKNKNAVLITEEETLFIVNWVWCEGNQADRNRVVFTSREDYEESLFDTIVETPTLE